MGARTFIPSFFFKSTAMALVSALLVGSYSDNSESLPKITVCEKLKEKIGNFGSLEEFYPFYLCEHGLSTTKLFHFIATFNSLASLARMGLYKQFAPSLIPLILLQGYGLAWISHFFIEKNAPVTFQHPFYSFVSDLRMFFDTLSLKFPPLISVSEVQKIYRDLF